MAPKEITIHLAYGTPLHCLFADHFKIHRNGGFFDLDFRCERSNQCLTIRMAAETIISAKDNLLNYLAQVGTPDSLPPSASNLPATIILPADHFGMARNGAMGEINFHCVNWQCAFEPSKGESAPESKSSFYIATIRCDVKLQQHWIAALYSYEN